MNKVKDESGKKNPKKASQKSKSFFTDERIRFLFGILDHRFCFIPPAGMHLLSLLVENRSEFSRFQCDLRIGCSGKELVGEKRSFSRKINYQLRIWIRGLLYTFNYCNIRFIPSELPRNKTSEAYNQVCFCRNTHFPCTKFHFRTS